MLAERGHTWLTSKSPIGANEGSSPGVAGVGNLVLLSLARASKCFGALQSESPRHVRRFTDVKSLLRRVWVILRTNAISARAVHLISNCEM